MRRSTGRSLQYTWNRADEDTASLSLPPCIYNRAPTFADRGVVPSPSLGVDWFAYAAKKLKALTMRSFDDFIAFCHECSDRSRSGVEDIHPEVIDDLAHLIEVRCHWNAFVNDHRTSIGERPVDDVAMTRDPSNIRIAPIYFAGLIVEHGLMGIRGVG